MLEKTSPNIIRKRIHLRVRKKIKGTSERPRLNVYRSLNNMYAQIIDDVAGVTLVSASSLDKTIKGTLKSGGNKEASTQVGKILAERAIEKGIKTVVFDRSGYIYHGRVKELAEAARAAGLDF
jgi:large subunit ribosomal protein L18